MNIYPTGIPLDPVATMDGGYALIYPNKTETIITPYSPQVGIYGLFLEYGTETTQGPFVLYQTQTPTSIISIECTFTYVGVGQTCIMVLNTTQTGQTTFVKMDFLSTGTVYNVKTFLSPGLTDYSIQSLQYGGYFLFNSQPYVNDKTRKLLYGYVMDYYGTLYNWSLPYPILTNSVADSAILLNNTLVIPQPEVGQSWSLLTTDLYKIEEARGKLRNFSF